VWRSRVGRSGYEMVATTGRMSVVSVFVRAAAVDLSFFGMPEMPPPGRDQVLEGSELSGISMTGVEPPPPPRLYGRQFTEVG
jgi:hypothetical protein